MDISIDLAFNNGKIKFTLDTDLQIGREQFSGITFDIGLELLPSGSSNYGWAMLPALGTLGGVIPPGYGVGSPQLPALTSSGEGGFYIPPELQYGFALLPPLSSSGLLKTSCPGDGDATLPAIQSKGGEGNYGEGTSVYLQSLQSKGYEGPARDTAYAISYCYLFEGMYAVTDYIIFINEVGTITGTISGTRSLIGEIITDLEISDSYSVLGTFLVQAISNGTLSAALQGSVITTDDIERPSIDPTSRAWVVNVETGATSQYDNYGFNSFIERDGEYFGLAEDGIYKLEGATDAGIPIPWQVDFGETNCGVPGRKKVPDVHIGTTEGTPMYLKITTENGTQTYKVEECLRGATGWRAKVYEDMFGTSWNFEVISEGAAELTGVEFTPIKLSRKL